MPLGIMDRSVPSGSHVCAFYSGSAGRDEVIALFLAEGLRTGPACAVEDQGVLLAAASRDREAIRSLEDALREYHRLGARRRHWASEQRPTAGWTSLTDIDHATARLVAEGLTSG